MKILMMGTGPFAVPTFEALIESKHEVLGLVTRPPAGSHRKKRKDINPMREAAIRYGIQVHDPPSVNGEEFAPVLRSFAADLFMVCDYGQILSSTVLGLSRLGGINLHGSLLPKYRGAAPINWAIYHGDPVTGNTVILMTPRLDGGPILDSVELPMSSLDTAVTVEEKLSQLGPESVLRSLDLLERWDGDSPIGLPQDPKEVTKAPRLKKTDGLLDWNRSADEILNQVRAFQPWPGSYSTWVRDSGNPKAAELRLILTRVSVREENDSSAPAGSVVLADEGKLVIQTGNGQIEVLSLQPSGKKNMPIADFLRGYPIARGSRLG